MVLANGVKRLIASVVAILVGIAFIVVGIVVLNINKNTDYVEITGKIDRIETVYSSVSDEADEHHVYVTYTYEGKDYRNEYGSYSISMNEGDEVTILVDSANPNNITSKGGAWMPYVFIVAGAIVSVVSVFGVFKSVRSVA